MWMILKLDLTWRGTPAPSSPTVPIHPGASLDNSRTSLYELNLLSLSRSLLGYYCCTSLTIHEVRPFFPASQPVRPHCRFSISAMIFHKMGRRSAAAAQEPIDG